MHVERKRKKVNFKGQLWKFNLTIYLYLIFWHSMQVNPLAGWNINPCDRQPVGLAATHSRRATSPEPETDCAHTNFGLQTHHTSHTKLAQWSRQTPKQHNLQNRISWNRHSESPVSYSSAEKSRFSLLSKQLQRKNQTVQDMQRWKDH